MMAILIAASLLLPLTAEAAERATADEAMALVKKAVALTKSAGRDKALAAFNDPNGDFQPKDLFIFVQDLKGLMVQHAKNPGLNGKDLSTLKDIDGKLFVAEMMTVSTEKGSGWVEYKWVNPQTKKIDPKMSYVEKVDDWFIGAGIFK
ncbi:MAG: cache domain-containing protein [Magnetospirillum sp.]|nr:cache domain-containing protein [Magnetospirillum sp.]